MSQKDDFDGPDMADTVRSIFQSLDQKDRVEPRKPVWALAIVVCLVLFLGGVLWYVYPREAATREVRAVPLIRADAGPIKVVPEDPGGMDIPHRDSTVFETLQARRDAEDGPRVENLLDDTEEPLPRAELFAGLKTEIKVEGKTVARTDGGAEKAGEDEPTETQAAAEENAGEAADEMREIAANTPVPASKPTPRQAQNASRTEPAAGVETYARGGYFVQLSSMGSDNAARQAWKTLQQKHAVLKPLDLRVEEADLGARGTYYRVQGGPVTEAKARDICAAVQSQGGGGCLVVKR